MVYSHGIRAQRGRLALGKDYGVRFPTFSLRSPARDILLIAFLAAVLCSRASGQQSSLSGWVRDSTGAAISNAEVTLRAGQFTSSTRTNSDGNFSFPSLPANAGAVRVMAKGFSPAEQNWTGSVQLSFTLKPLVNQQVVVSATRSEMKLSETPGSAVLLSSEDMAANPALTLDDMLRQIPGFSLFRRASSRVANPTTQGVSLRGLGASGPSRALVLEDGVPIVDPFGGWVYWDRVPRAEVSDVEVFRGGASNLYGSDALGGVVQFINRVPNQSAASIDMSYGNQNTPDLSSWAGTKMGRWDMEAAADLAYTDGYILVPSFQRGLVDNPANSEHATVDGGVGYRLADGGRAFLRGTFFDEDRHNGTMLETNSTGMGFAVAGFNTRVGPQDWISARAYGQSQGYDQSFSSVAPDRNQEALTDLQHVPSQQSGGELQWNHLFSSQTLVAGADANEVMGASDEQLFSSASGAHFANNLAGGRQRTVGVFGEDIIRAGPWTFTAGARFDDWNNFKASTLRMAVPSAVVTGMSFPDRSETSFSPRLSVMRNFRRDVAAYVSGYRAFRAPTLNELYRSFRQGTTLTENNPLLGAERLTGAEAGVRGAAFDNAVELRGDVFWGDIVDPVTNVTLSTTPNLVTAERQNLGRTRAIGTELDGVVHVRSSIAFSAGYEYTHATVLDTSVALNGLNVAEVPRNQFTFEARYWNPRTVMLSLEGRYSSSQFDNDINTLLLNQYFVIDLYMAREITHGIEVYAAAENLLNQRYATALSPPQTAGGQPLQTLGPPILARVGVRFDFPRAK
jgi:outer membrane receptor protein involved in Fe transport